MIGCAIPALKRVLCLGAHSDDVEIGCGGTILKLISRTPGLEFLWFVASADEERRREAHSSARNFLKDAAGAEIRVGNFRESYFPEQWGGLKREIEKLKSRFAPDLIFTHYREDRHQVCAQSRPTALPGNSPIPDSDGRIGSRQGETDHEHRQQQRPVGHPGA